jgi:hypothetical protein
MTFSSPNKAAFLFVQKNYQSLEDPPPLKPESEEEPLSLPQLPLSDEEEPLSDEELLSLAWL